MNKKQLLEDIWDVLMRNNEYITQNDFYEKYVDYFVEIDMEHGEIVLCNNSEEYVITINKR